MEVIQELANQLGVATEYVIGAYAPYYTARTIANTVIALLVLVVSTITFVKCISKYLKENNIDETTADTMVALMIVCSIASIVSFVCSWVLIPDMVGTLVSPTGAAIKDIVTMACNG